MRREVYTHRLRETLCQKMKANPGFTFLQINICGLSDHRKIALNQFLQQTKPDIVFPNETKTQISANQFDNYTTVSCIGRSSGASQFYWKNTSLTQDIIISKTPLLIMLFWLLGWAVLNQLCLMHLSDPMTSRAGEKQEKVYRNAKRMLTKNAWMEPLSLVTSTQGIPFEETDRIPC